MIEDGIEYKCLKDLMELRWKGR